MSDMLEIVEIVDGREAACRAVLEDLPDWFGIPEATDMYIRAAGQKTMLACRHDGDIAGLVTLDRLTEVTVDIHVMGVLARHHRHGIGAALIAAAADWARGQGARLLAVKTLGAGYPDPFYQKTRLFYQATGFLPVEEFKEIWGPDQPCLLMVKPLDDS